MCPNTGQTSVLAFLSRGGGCGFLLLQFFGGFGPLTLLVAAIVELLVGGLFLHPSIMS